MPVWTCPHCAHIHTPATITHHSDGKSFQCQNPTCKQSFDAGAVYVWKKNYPGL